MDGYKLVEQAEKPPAKCIASRDTEGPMIDTGNNITERGRVYVSVRWLKEAAEEFCDMVSREEVQGHVTAMEDQLQSYATRVEELEELVDARDKLIKAARKVEA